MKAIQNIQIPNTLQLSSFENISITEKKFNWDRLIPTYYIYIHA